MRRRCVHWLVDGVLLSSSLLGLGGDAGIDWLKNKTTGNGKSIYDEHIVGGILPRWFLNGGPKTFLPGLYINSCSGQPSADCEIS